MFTTILVPIDGSKFSERALSLAIPLAEQHGARLVLAQAHEPIPPLAFGGGAPVHDLTLDAQWEAEGRASLERLAKRTAKLTSSPVVALFREGRVVPTLLAVIKESAAEIVVMSTHGRGGFQRFWLGSVADAIVRGASVPVMLVRGGRPPAKRLAWAAPFTRLLVPVDGSPRAERAIGVARALVGRTAARMVLVHVLHPMSAAAGANLKRDPVREAIDGYLAPLALRMATPTLEVRHEAQVDANVARVLLEAVDRHDADVVVLSGQGLSGVQRLMVGSVADKLIRTSPVPVLVVPSAEGSATIHA